MVNYKNPRTLIEHDDDGFLKGISLEGSRTYLKEKILLETKSNNELQGKLIALVKNKEFQKKSEDTYFERELILKAKEKIQKLNDFFASLYVFNDEIGIIRILLRRRDNEETLIPKFFYKIWIIGRINNYRIIKVKFESEVDRPSWGLVGGGVTNRMPQESSFSEISKYVISLYYSDKLTLFLEHEKTRFKDFKHRIKGQIIFLEYSSPLNEFTKFELKDSLSEMTISFERERFKRTHDGYHFVINKNDWITAFSIITTFTSYRETTIKGKLKARRKGISYSKLYFDKLELDNIPKYNTKNEVYYLTSDDKRVPLTYKKRYYKMDSKNNIEKLERCIDFLNKLDPAKHPLKFETIFILPDDASIVLISASFIRYSLGYPMIYSKNLVERIKRLENMNIISRRIYFIGVQPKKETLAELKNLGYKVYPLIYSCDREKQLLKIQSEFLKQLAADCLITSYSYLSKKGKASTGGSKKANLDLYEQKRGDILTQREQIIQSFSERAHKLLSKCYKSDSKINQEYLKANFAITNFIEENQVFEILRIYRNLENLVYFYDEQEKSTKLYPERKKSFPHLILYDSALQVSSFIALTIYAVYKGLPQIPIDSSKLEIFRRRASEDAIIHEINTKNHKKFKKILDSYGKKLSSILTQRWKEFIVKYTSAVSAQESESKNVNLGYLTLFLSFSDIFYEAMIINSKSINSNFSVGRFPTDIPEICMNAVRNSFRQYEGPRPIWNPISITTFTHKQHSEHLIEFMKEIKIAFSKLRKNFNVKDNQQEFSKEFVLKNLNDRNIAILWMHGNQISMELKKDYEYLELKDIRFSKFGISELTILNSCSTAGYNVTQSFSSNIAIELLNAGFLGVCAPFWDIYPEYAAFFTKKYITHMIFGIPCSSVIRHEKSISRDKGIFINEYIYYGDPTYSTDSFFPDERRKIEKKLNEIFVKYFEP